MVRRVARQSSVQFQLLELLALQALLEVSAAGLLFNYLLLQYSNSQASCPNRHLQDRSDHSCSCGPLLYQQQEPRLLLGLCCLNNSSRCCSSSGKPCCSILLQQGGVGVPLSGRCLRTLQAPCRLCCLQDCPRRCLT
jgi:hypothetical protein